MTKALLGITLKFPEPGRVKTRLSKEIGRDNAARVSRVIAEHVLKNTRSSGGDYERIIFFSPDGMRDEFARWLKDERLLPQKGADIGEIMLNALSDLFRAGAQKGVIVGADIPDLSRSIVGDAFSELDHVDIVIGPATDGGYYLIGMKSLHPEIFRGIAWSTGRVLEDTVSLIRKSGLTYKEVSVLSDVDSLKDLEKFTKNFAGI
jgi:hypothetical protein